MMDPRHNSQPTTYETTATPDNLTPVVEVITIEPDDLDIYMAAHALHESARKHNEGIQQVFKDLFDEGRNAFINPELNEPDHWPTYLISGAEALLLEGPVAAIRTMEKYLATHTKTDSRSDKVPFTPEKAAVVAALLELPSPNHA